MRKLLLLTSLCVLILSPARLFSACAGGDCVYLYSFFREPDGVGGLMLAYSEDFFHWKELPGPFFQPKVGTPTRQKNYSHMTFRDAFVAPDPAGGYRMVWTTGWSGRNIGYARSADLVHWEDEKTIPVMEHREAAVNCWAPKLFYDSARKQWLIFWSTTLEDDTFPKSDVPHTTGNHRIWYVTTRDFQSFSTAALFFDPGYPAIDAYLMADAGKYYLFFKDQRSNNRRVAPVNPMYMNIRIAHGDTPYGPFGDISEPVTGKGKGVWLNEGPSAIRVGDYTYVFYDHYGGDNYYGAARSRDMKVWEEATLLFTFPPRSKHGHIFAVPRKAVAHLLTR